jgi:hypothetical protein
MRNCGWRSAETIGSHNPLIEVDQVGIVAAPQEPTESAAKPKSRTPLPGTDIFFGVRHVAATIADMLLTGATPFTVPEILSLASSH